MTSAASRPAVHLNPENRNVVRPCGSQRGSPGMAREWPGGLQLGPRLSLVREPNTLSKSVGARSHWVAMVCDLRGRFVLAVRERLRTLANETRTETGRRVTSPGCRTHHLTCIAWNRWLRPRWAWMCFPEPPVRLAVLLPHWPNPDGMALFQSASIEAVWPHGWDSVTLVVACSSNRPLSPALPGRTGELG